MSKINNKRKRIKKSKKGICYYLCYNCYECSEDNENGTNGCCHRCCGKFFKCFDNCVNIIMEKVIAVIAIAKNVNVQQDVVKYAVAISVWDVVIYVLSTKYY